MKNGRQFGLILLVFNSLPQGENPPNPTTEDGTRKVAEELIESLIDHWDDGIAHGCKMPMLILSTHWFEGAVSSALDHPVAKKLGDILLQWTKIPQIKNIDNEGVKSLIPLLEVRRHILAWIERHVLEVVMVKPFTNFGANIDRNILQYIAQQRPPISNNSSISARDNISDVRPLATEVVPFDGKEGPLLGLYKGDGNPRPVVMPSAEWRRQDYHPQVQDERATGTIYLNMPLIRYYFRDSPYEGLTPLDHWSSNPLNLTAVSSWPSEFDIFEEAFRDLVLLLKTRPIKCPPERGLRGLRRATRY